MSTVPKIFNVNSAKVSPILPLMQFWEARKNNHYEYQWPLTITFWVCKTLLQIMIEILKICSPHPMAPPSIWTIAFSNCSHSCLFFSRSNYFKSVLKFIQPLSVVGKFLYHQINDQNQQTNTLRVVKLLTTVQMTIWQRVHYLVICLFLFESVQGKNNKLEKDKRYQSPPPRHLTEMKH